MWPWRAAMWSGRSPKEFSKFTMCFGLFVSYICRLGLLSRNSLTMNKLSAPPLNMLVIKDYKASALKNLDCLLMLSKESSRTTMLWRLHASSIVSSYFLMGKRLISDVMSLYKVYSLWLPPALASLPLNIKDTSRSKRSVWVCPIVS